MNGFSQLQKISERLGDKELVSSLEKGKRYLKTSYPQHCIEDSDIASHSINYGISDPKCKELQESHNISGRVCQDCFDLCHTMTKVKNLAEQLGAEEDTVYDINIAIKNIQEYVCHIMRDAQQKNAKDWCMENLTETSGFWLKDFCQKIIPVQFREGQHDYFGKKGISLHVDILFTKKDGNLQKNVYFTSIYRCDQGVEDVLSLADSLIGEFKKDQPLIQSLYVKSDNASCYHGNFCAEGLRKVCMQNGITLERYDYNEPCKGKDQCDRENAGAKSLMRSFVDAGNDILSADDLKQALMYGKGLKNTNVGVAVINSDQSKINGIKIAKVSQFHSISFEKDHMRL